MVRNYKDLDIWKKSLDVVLRVYALIAKFPEFEKNNFIDQARRTSSSISLNIVEGCSRRSNKQCLYYLNVAYSSARELETIFILAQRLNYVDKVQVVTFLKDLNILCKMIFAFMRAIEKDVLDNKNKIDTVGKKLGSSYY